MKKGIILFGPSGCGKTALSDYISENFRYTNIVATTTRDPRKNEIDGVHYHFVSPEEFHRRASADLFLETSKHGDWWYGTEFSEINDKDYGIIVVNVDGVKALKKMYGELFKAIYIELDEKERLVRQVLRGDEIGEIARRFYTDKKLFASAYVDADYAINMNGTSVEKGVVEILELMK
jgi:guanylate kinase